MTPKSHILQSAGTQVMCNSFMPIMYRLNEEWYKLLPRPVEARTPATLQPDSSLTWKFTELATLAKSGIYSYDDLNRLREHIMFPQERGAILNTLTRRATGMDTDHDGVTIMKFLDENALNHIASSTWQWFKDMAYE